MGKTEIPTLTLSETIDSLASIVDSDLRRRREQHQKNLAKAKLELAQAAADRAARNAEFWNNRAADAVVAKARSKA
jgi:hypothetical protein